MLPPYVIPMFFSIVTAFLLWRRETPVAGVISLLYTIAVIALFSTGGFDEPEFGQWSLMILNVITVLIGIPLLLAVVGAELIIRRHTSKRLESTNDKSTA